MTSETSAIASTATPEPRPPFGRALRSAAALVIVIVLVGCGTTSHRPGATGSRACCAASPTASSTPEPLSDRSLYQVQGSWTNDTGRPFHFAELRGRPQLVVMFFASCRYACPLLVHDLRRIEAALPPKLRDHTGFVLVSFDSRRDTPEALAAYREGQHLPRDRWTLLHGQPEDVLELAALLGVQFKADGEGQFTHSNLISILDAEGELVGRQTGLGQNPAETIATLQRLARETPETAAAGVPRSH